MIKDLSIQNYRIFEDFHIDNFARVNLIVGSNNSGKSSLLEAIRLLTSDDVATDMIHMLYNRGEYLYSVEEQHAQILQEEGYQFNNLFHGRRTMPGTSFKIQSDSLDTTLNVQLGTASDFKTDSTEKLLGETKVAYEVNPNEDTGSSSSDAVSIIKHSGRGKAYNKLLTPLENAVLYQHVRSPKRIREKATSRFLTANMIEYTDLAVLWNSIALTPNEDKIVKALQLIEPTVERIGFTSRQTYNSGILVRLSNDPQPIPLGSMGEGMRRMLAIAMTLASLESGTLLIDEIDTGLHHMALTDMWQLVAKEAIEQDVQVFATTHSWDCVRAFQEALLEAEIPKKGRLVRIDESWGKLRPIHYTVEDLEIAIDHEIEVR